MSEIKSMVQALLGQREGIRSKEGSVPIITIRAGGAQGRDRDVTQIVTPADQGVSGSPAEVMRKVGSQLDGGFRRTFDAQLDLVSLNILDAQTADHLVRQFIARRGRFLPIHDESDLTSGGDLRRTSPFLHAVCCLQEMRFTQRNSDGLVQHRKVFEHVRRMLGEVMVASPLPFEELTGVLIMALSGASPSRGSEYLDSWLLSGHCAQQAMLSIKFSEIFVSTSRGTSPVADQRAIRVWANICLVHLHWAATTGRPSTLPISYLMQCRALLDFELATMRDGMLYAEITLYSAVEQKLSRESYLNSDGTCEELLQWKRKWSHLLELPTSLVLNLSYGIAWLILARRSLGHLHNETHSPLTPTDHAEEKCSCEAPSQVMRVLVCESAVQVITAFLRVPESWGTDLPDFYLLCVSYAMLVLSKYELTPSNLSGHEIIKLLESVERRYGGSQPTPTAMQFSLERALRKVRASVGCYSRDAASSDEEDHPPRAGPTGDSSSGGENSAGPGGLESADPAVENQQTDFADAMLGRLGTGADLFEGMEYFFSGDISDRCTVATCLMRDAYV